MKAFFPLRVSFFLTYNSASNPLESSYLAYALVLVSSLQIFTFNGFISNTKTVKNQATASSVSSLWLNQWLHFLDFNRFSSWEILNNTNCLLQIICFILFLATGLLGLFSFIFTNRLTGSNRLVISTFKSFFTLCDMLLYIPALDFLTHSYIPNTDLANQVPFGTFQSSSSSSPALTVSKTSFGWFRIIYLLAFLAYFFIRKYALSVGLPFRAILQSKLCYNDSLFEHFRIISIFILSIVDWRVREHGLSALSIDIISCCFGVLQIVLSLRWMTYHYYKTHLLHGLISSFYLSHSVILLVRHQLEVSFFNSTSNTINIIGLLDVAYFSTGIFSMWVFYNLYQKIYSLKISSSSSSPSSLPVIAEQYNIHKLFYMKQDKRLDAETCGEIIHYFQCHFAVCSDAQPCPCSELLLKPYNELSSLKELKLTFSELHDSKAVEEFMTARLAYFLTTPNSRFFGRLDYLVRLISYLALQLDNPVQACFMVARFSTIMDQGSDKFQIFYAYLLAEIKRIAFDNLSEEEKNMNEYNICDGIAFDEELQKAKAQDLKIRGGYTKFFSYLYKSNRVDLEELHKRGRRLLESIEDIEATFAKLSKLNSENAELFVMIINFKKSIRGESGYSLAVLNAKLADIFQKRSMRLLYKKTEQKALFSHYGHFDEKTMFLMVDLFHNHGAILQASQKFYTTFGISQELERNINLNSIILPHLREGHHNTLLHLSQNADAFLTKHTFDDLIFGLNRERLLVPFHLFAKIEVQGHHVCAAASLQIQKEPRSCIILDERGFIVSFTKDLEHLFEGLQNLPVEKRVNICLLIPALIPVIFSEQSITNNVNGEENMQPITQQRSQRSQRNNSTTNSLSTLMLMTHRLLQDKATLTHSKEYIKLTYQINRCSDIQSLGACLINFLNILSEEFIDVFQVNLEYTYRRFQGINSAHWEVQIMKLKAIQEPTNLKDIILTFTTELGLPTLLSKRSERENRLYSDLILPTQFSTDNFILEVAAENNESNEITDRDKNIGHQAPMLTKDYFKFIEISNLKNNSQTNDKLLDKNIFKNSGRNFSQQAASSFNNWSQIHPSTSFLEINPNSLRTKEKELDRSSDVNEGSLNFEVFDQASFKNPNDIKTHFSGIKFSRQKTKAFNKKPKTWSSSKYSAETANTSRLVRQMIKENNSMQLIKTHYYSGIIALLIILVMITIDFLVTNSALTQLANLTSMNIHPTQSAALLERSKTQCSARGLLDKKLVDPNYNSVNLYLQPSIFSLSMADLPYLFSDNSSDHILEAHNQKYPIPVTIPQTGEVQNMSLFSAMELILNYEYQRAVDSINRVSILGDNYYPRIFAELNTQNIVDNLLIYMSEIQIEIGNQNNTTVSLNLITLCIGCVCTFFALICLGVVYSKIKNKQSIILALFCKISKKDLHAEAVRFFNGAYEFDKSKTNSKEQSQLLNERARERLFTNFVTPKRHYLSRGVALAFLYCILIVPFLTCYFKLLGYSTIWATRIAQYDTWEITRTQYAAVYAASQFAYFNSDSNDTVFQNSVNLFQTQLDTYGPLFQEFEQLYTQIALSQDQAVYSQNTSAELSHSLSQSFCSYIYQPSPNLTKCNTDLGGIAQNGLINAMNYAINFLDQKISILDSSADRVATMYVIGHDSTYSQSLDLLVGMTLLLRNFSDDMNTDLLAYLTTERNTLLIILVIAVVGYLLLMLIGWTALIRKLSYELNQTKRILDILPTRLLQGNLLIRNTLIKTMKINIT